MVFNFGMFFFIGCVSLESTRCEGVVFNGTDEVLMEVYIAPSGTNFLTLLFTDVSQNKTQSFSVNVNFSSRYWDIHAMGISGTAYTLFAVRLDAGETLCITSDDAAAEELFDEEAW